MVGNGRIWESKNEKLLEIIIDKKLDFNEYILRVCLKARRKITALGGMSKYLHVDKRITLFKAFIHSQFAY